MIALALLAVLTASQADLNTVLKTAQPGDEIRVSGQIIGPIAANFPAPGVTLTAEPGASLGPNPARSNWFTVQGSGMTFRGFAVTSGGGAAIGVLTGSSRITFDGLDFTGLGAVATGGGSGISVRDSTDIAITNSRFRNATGGVSVGNLARNITVSAAPWSAEICRASTLPSSEVLLMSPRSQRKSRAVMQATPWWRCSAEGGFIALVIANTVG